MRHDSTKKKLCQIWKTDECIKTIFRNFTEYVYINVFKSQKKVFKIHKERYRI